MSQEDRDRYLHHSHRMQAGVEFTKDKGDQTPKQLRVGINAAMSDISGLATFLIKKGIFTENEYIKALADAMEREANSYEKNLQRDNDSPNLKLGSLYPLKSQLEE